MIIKSDYRIASVLDGYGVLLRNKHFNDAEHLSMDDTVLFVHGATYGSTLTFDYPIAGRSWMDLMAEAGFDVWCLDLLGYGLSERPGEMDQPAEDNTPLVDTDHAVREVDRAVDFIRSHRDIERVSLIGYSWGSAICGRYAGEFAAKVNRLVLSGALWVEQQPEINATIPGAYRTVDVAAMAKRWQTGLSDDDFARIVDADRVNQWCNDAVACDPKGIDTGLLRAPTGVMKDYLHHASTGEPWYDPGLIEAPTQIIVGEHDAETTPVQAQKVFSLLDGDLDRRLTTIGSGTHSLLLENNRYALYSVVAGFLA